MAYTVLNGTTVYPAQVSYQKIILTANITLSWPSSFATSIVAAGFNDVEPDQSGWTITLPDATLASLGNDIIFNNISSYDFTIKKNDGNDPYTVPAGQIVDFKLYDNSTSAGGWRIIPFLGGYNGVTSFTAQSSDGTIVITDGVVAPPGATIDFQLPESIKNLNNVNTTGLTVIKNTSPLTWGTAQLIGGSNITITNPDGVVDNPTINVNNALSGLTSLQVGRFSITGSSMTTISSGESLNFYTTDDGQDKGLLILNDVTINSDGKMIVNGELEVTGTFKSPFTPKAWCVFTDTLNSDVHDITSQNGANVSSIEFVSTGNYKITFTTPLSNINYGVLVTMGTTGGSNPFVSHGFWSVRELNYVTVTIVDASGELVSSVPNGATVIIMST